MKNSLILLEVKLGVIKYTGKTGLFKAFYNCVLFNFQENETVYEIWKYQQQGRHWYSISYLICIFKNLAVSVSDYKDFQLKFYFALYQSDKK